MQNSKLGQLAGAEMRRLFILDMCINVSEDSCEKVCKIAGNTDNTAKDAPRVILLYAGKCNIINKSQDFIQDSRRKRQIIHGKRAPGYIDSKKRACAQQRKGKSAGFIGAGFGRWARGR